MSKDFLSKLCDELNRENFIRWYGDEDVPDYNGITTLADLDAEGNEVNTTTLNTHNNPRFSIAEAPVKEDASTISQEKEQIRHSWIANHEKAQRKSRP